MAGFDPTGSNRQPLFNRACELIIGSTPKDNNFVQVIPDALKISGLRVVFRIDLTEKKEPNTAKIEVYNLSASSRKNLQEKGVRVVLQAGYLGSLEQIFSGDARTTDHKVRGPDVVTECLCGDGERAFRYADYAASFAPGAAVGDVIKDVVKALGINAGNASSVAEKITTKYLSGFSTSGRASDVLTELLEPNGYGYSIQGGRIEILKPNEVLPDSGPLLDADSGLIGSPEFGMPDRKGKPSTLKCRSLLQGRFRPGIRFELRSEGIKGMFRCRKVTHHGDTNGGDWYSDIEATSSP